MRYRAYSFLLLLTCFQPVFAQRIGEPYPVKLLGTSSPLTLEFSDRDYMLVLYSLNTDGPPDLENNPEYDFSVFSVSTGANAVTVHNSGVGTATPAGGGLEAQLRRQEQELARRVRQTGGYRPSATKVAPHLVGARRFVFPAFGNVADTTVTAVLLAGGHRATAYVDVSDTGRVSRTRIQADVDLFSLKIHPVVTSALVRDPGAGDIGRVYLLYTHLVDEVGDDTTTVRGFFNAASVLPENQGGNGDQINLLFINPFNDPDVTDAVLAHEFQHLFSFYQHVLIRNGRPEENWLNEGLSHVCEDLVGGHEAHNRQNIERFLTNPHRTPLRGSVENPGVRGAGYLFVRSLIEDYGTEILSRLTQTNRVGISNVKNAAGDRITDIYERHLSRLFLSGLGLNATLDYTTPFLADTTSGARTFPHPEEFLVSPETSPAIGSVQPLSGAFVRLSYETNRTIWIQTDAEGLFRAVLIPIPPGDRTRISIPTDFFTNITLDTPVSGPFMSYKPIRISGAVSDPLVSEVRFSLLRTDYGVENAYRVPVRDGKFRHTFFFSHEQAGDYRLQAETRREDQQDFSPAGTFNAFTIQEGPETSPIPVGYFTDILFSSPIPVAVETGQALRLSGTVSDPSITLLSLGFWHDDINEYIFFEAPVIDGQFATTIFFAHRKAGVYDFAINRYRGNTAYSSPQDGFGPFVVRRGEGTALLPVDFFRQITLDSPMPVAYRIGQGIGVAGTVLDRSVSQIEFRFFASSWDGSDQESPPGSFSSIREFYAPVVNGRFNTVLSFPPEQRIGDDYALEIWLWGNGSRSLGFRRFEPISIEAPPSPDFNSDGSVGFADFIALAEAFGRTTTDEDFDPRFDLDGDGTIGFGDFLIFARAFGLRL